MPIHLRENQYQGVNAHLNSYLQNEAGGWESFHTDYITFLRVALDNQLPSGYVARSEMGLQISEITPSVRPASRTKPDITIFKTRSTTRKADANLAVATPTALFAIPDTLEVDEYLPGLVIYQSGEDTPPGRPITRLEVLSPANKPGGSHHRSYNQKRLETLLVGLRLVEIDYLHQTRPIIPTLASYPDKEIGAYPYGIIVTDPRPSLEQGQSRFYGFKIDETLEPIEIPLAGADAIIFDFGMVYNQFFENTRFFGEIVDYEQVPVRFETYTPADQGQIKARMQAVAESI